MTLSKSMKSPRLMSLKKDLESGNSDALRKFWKEIKTESTPMVEPAEGETDQSLITFLWQTNQSQTKKEIKLPLNFYLEVGAIETGIGPAGGSSHLVSMDCSC